MARSDVLVTTDWAESNLDATNTVFVEVDEDTSAYDGGHIAGAVKLDWKIRFAATSSTRRSSRSCCPIVESPTTTR
jgi:3-mercaptopyruvate sulfurtransferase SseA